jgi:hypothetical protein
LLALLGTFALATNGTRYVGVAALIVAAVLAVLIWGRQSWIPILPKDIPLQPHASIKKNVWLSAAVAGAAVILLAADLYNAGNPNDQFGLAGWLWLLSSGVLIAGSLGWSALNLHTKEEAAPIPPVAERASSTLPVCRLGRANHEHEVPGTDYSLLTNRYSESLWCPWEAAVFAGIVLLASVLRIWNLSAYPDNIYPDEIMTGTVALGAYGGSTAAPSLFSTLWSQIDLPSLWFRIVWAFLQMGGDNLTMLRMPAALFGVATTVPFYLLVRGVWGRAAAIASTAILAFSASNIHYSRLALSNIVTAFFWTLCFLFLLRGLRSGKPINWDCGGTYCRTERTFLLWHAPAAVRPCRVLCLSRGNTLATSPPLPLAFRTTGPRLRGGFRAVARPFHPQSQSLFRSRGRNERVAQHPDQPR